jgi:DNA primase
MDVDDEDHVEAYMYLVLDRKISREDILKYRLGFCTVGKYSKKIVIPSYDVNGEVSYFVTRTYDSKERTKYDNPKHDKSSIIFNEGLINWDSVVFLVEGVFDMIRLPNSIPLLGKDVSTLLFKKLKKHKPKIIVVLDPDAWKGEMDLYDMLRLIYDSDTDNIRIMNLSGRDDIDEITKKFGQEELIKKLYTARKLNDNDYFGRKMTGIKHNGRWYYGDRK